MIDKLNQIIESIPELQNDIEQKVLISLHERLLSNFIATLSAATLIFIVIWHNEKNQVYLAWYLLTIFIVLVRLIENAKFKRHRKTGGDISVWKNRFDIGTLASGSIWGFVAAIIAPVLSTEIHSFILLFCGGLLSAAVTAYQASLRTYLAFALPIIIPVAVVYISSGNLVDMAIGIMIICFAFILSTYLIQINRRFIEHITLQAQNISLVSTLKLELEEHERSRQALETTKQENAQLVEDADDVIYKTDVRANLIYVNKMTEQKTGYSRSELLKMKSLDFIAPDFKIKIKKLYLGKAKAGISKFKHETPVVRKNGELIWGEMNVQCIYKNGQPEEYQIVVRDITERKITERALFNAELLTRQILNTAGDGIYGLDLEGNTTFTNPAAAKMVGRNPEELIGKPQHALIHHSRPDGSPYPREECPIYAAFNDGKIHHATDEVFWRKDGSSFPVEYTSTPIIENGIIQGAVVTFKDITRRKEDENKLHRAKEEAISAKSLQEEFIASISHEIRTPMNAVVGFVDLLSAMKLNKEQRQYLDGLDLSSRRLLSVINDLLDMSKIQSGKLTFSLSKMRIIDAITSIIETLRPEADTKNLDIFIKVEGKIPEEIIFDSLRFDQIIQNLLSNAVKYTHKGKIQVIIKTLSKNNNKTQLQISVKDKGIGIPENLLPTIFHDFHQVHEKPDEYHGTGLGLSIVKRLVEMRGGEVFAKSELNKGSDIGFTMWFEVPENVEEVEDDSEEITTSDDNHLKRKHIKSLKLLVADDNDMNLIIISKFMEAYTENITVDTVVNGIEALNKAKSENYDLIFMDLQMPEMNGYEASNAIRKLSGGAEKTPIMALTAALPPTVKLNEAGINDFLLKPFTRDALYEKTDQILEL